MTARILECINKLGADNSISSYLFDALGAKKSKKVLSKEEQVFVQAIRHNLRLDNLDILRENRPSEPEYILKYRNDNLRQITIENSEKFIAELVNTFNNSGFTLQDASDKLKEFLNQLEVYAGKCFSITAEHLQNIKQLSTIEELLKYDYTAKYPNKVILNENQC